jgi:hypothetical protein
MALYTVKNTQPGPRGIWSDGVLTYIDPATIGDDGKPVDGTGMVLAELTDDDKALADKSGYFEISKATAADKKALAPEPDAPPTQ